VKGILNKSPKNLVGKNRYTKKNRRCYQFEQNFETVRWNKEINRTTKKQSFQQVHVQNKKHQKKMQNISKTENTKKKKKKKKRTAG
jgi:hypothetical protein